MTILFSNIAETLLTHKGEPFSLEEYTPLKDIYNDSAKTIVLKAGRQIAKSTTLCNRLILRGSMISYYNQLYVVPQQVQATRFSRHYLDATLRKIPLRKHLLGKDSIVNVLTKTFMNGSIIQLTYIGDGNVDRARGIPSDENAYDEVQDMLWDDINIVDQCMSGSKKYGYSVNSGTPKTVDNTLEKLFSMSSQNEWVIKCPGCNTYNIPILPHVYKMLQKKGLSCYHCGKLIDPRTGEWIAFRPEYSGRKEGYHLPQIIIPRNVFDKDLWDKIMENYENYPEDHFANEILGLSMDLGGRLLTDTEIKKCCSGPSIYKMQAILRYSDIVMGVDWTVQGNKESFTIAVVLGLKPDNRFEVLYIHKFKGGEILDQIDTIIGIAKKYNVSCFGCDHGAGHCNNLLLMQRTGLPVHEFCYVPRQKKLLVWNESDFIYRLARTTSLNIMFLEIKTGKFVFPPEKEFLPYIDELLSLYEDYNELTSTKRFVRTPGRPDDFTHALNFAVIALKHSNNISLLSEHAQAFV